LLIPIFSGKYLDNYIKSRFFIQHNPESIRGRMTAFESLNLGIINIFVDAENQFPLVYNLK